MTYYIKMVFKYIEESFHADKISQYLCIYDDSNKENIVQYITPDNNRFHECQSELINDIHKTGNCKFELVSCDVLTKSEFFIECL